MKDHNDTKNVRKNARRITAYAAPGIVLFLLVTVGLVGCGGKKSDLTEVRLNEVAHSIFYAPQYVAMELGYFKGEGIDLQVDTGFGADKTATAVISGDADIAFMGPEATIYQYIEGNEDYFVNFAQLTQRAGNFVVSRTEDTDFEWEDLIGKEVIGGRAGGMPEMVLEYVLKKHNIDSETDLTLVQNIDFNNTSGAFIGGTGDYTVEFEPSATLIEEQGEGYVVASVGMESGYVPYTAYSVKKSFLEENRALLQAFTNAIEKGQKYVEEHTAAEVAKVIAPQFTDTDVETIEKIVERYANQDSYKTNTCFEEDSFTLLEDILEEAGELSERVPYEDLVTTEFSGK
ncbi:MAG: ABC transporter substrate-binding protein [Clostridiales bacterium]|nr:ABC transporter substrate-binding protein [Clostridiales bacterium]